MLHFDGQDTNLFSQMTQPVISFDCYGVIGYINPVAQKQFPEIKAGENIEHYFKSLLWSSVYDRLEDGLPASFSSAFLDGDHYYLNLLPLGTSEKFLGGLCSITDRLAAMGDPGFAGFLHDLKNPLLTAHSALDLALHFEVGERQQLYFDIAQRNLKSAISLLKNANRNINLADRESYKFKRVCITSLVHEIVEDFCSSGQRGVPSSIEVSAPEYDLFACCDATKIKQVVYNLLDNAFKHGSGEIKLSLSSVGESVRIGVYSSGIPLSPDSLPVLTLPFYSSDPQNGSGLGLYIANKVISTHGGQLFCTPVEDGNIFGFTLPFNEDLNLKSCAAQYFLGIDSPEAVDTTGEN